MTNEKAIKHLEVIKGDCALVGDIRALDMGISALKGYAGMTNGDVIISLYPNLKYTIQNGRVVTTIGVASSFDLDWWNAPYKGESEE